MIYLVLRNIIENIHYRFILRSIEFQDIFTNSNINKNTFINVTVLFIYFFILNF